MPFDINLPLTQLTGYNIQNDTAEKEEQSTLLKFDAIFCLEVFEYVWNPVQAIQNIYDLMTNDSVAYISFPSIYPVHNPAHIDYLRYTKQAILKYLSLHEGFKHIEVRARVATSGRSELSKFYNYEGMHPLRKSELPFDIGYLVTVRKLLY